MPQAAPALQRPVKFGKSGGPQSRILPVFGVGDKWPAVLSACPPRCSLVTALVAVLVLGASVTLLTPCRADAGGRHALRGTASWYGRYHHGRKTASGVRFDMRALTAAHRTLPLGTRLRVRLAASGRVIEVVVNDRGPYFGRRIIDLSRESARQLGMLRAGLGEVELEILRPPMVAQAHAPQLTKSTPTCFIRMEPTSVSSEDALR